ncbi:hypothetical protein GQ457_03G019170 [Hibiscus cannabinus]
MTRSNPRGPRFDLDPEIERTQKQLKRRIRDLMERNNNNGQPPADGQNLPAQADGAIIPPSQQMNQQLLTKTVHDYLAEDLKGLNPVVTMPDFEAEHFQLKPVMFNMLNTLGQFGGTPNENARQNLKPFLEICNSFKIHGVSNDALKLKLFPYSLRDKAKTWLNNLQPGSLQSWTQLCRSFLAKFSYTNMTDHLRNQITSFSWADIQILSTRPIGGFPSDTEVSKGATHEQWKAITTRSGNILKSNQEVMVANPSPATDTPAKADELAQASEDHSNPHTTTGESSAESSRAQSGKPEKIRPPPPFPQRLKKQKQDYQFKKFLDILKQVHINLPLVEALQQMPNYAKFLKDMVTRKKRIEEFETAAATETCLALMHNKVPAKKTDPGSFTIECFIGHNYPTKALCDPGASINLMPKSVFQKLGIGEAKPTTVMLQLAYHSYVQPEGKIEDILVQVDKFIFPADFLILDCEADEYAPIILGKPFLSTSRAVVGFDKVENNSVKMKSLTKKLNKGKNTVETPAKDTQRAKLYMGAHVERDKATMSLRDA